MSLSFNRLISFIIAALCLSWTAIVIADSHQHYSPALEYESSVNEVNLTDKEWKQLLPHERFVILRQKGTERAFSGQYDKFYEKGTYICAACGNPLFDSQSKYDSKTGWPSYWQPKSDQSVSTQVDRKLLFFVRTEVVCKRCGSHLGHVFEDGPRPTGLRYCINSRALSFIPD